MRLNETVCVIFLFLDAAALEDQLEIHFHKYNNAKCSILRSGDNSHCLGLFFYVEFCSSHVLRLLFLQLWKLSYMRYACSRIGNGLKVSKVHRV